jgi:hypothetical protein
VRRLGPASRAPVALAAFLALPVFFASLMAATLAIESARVVEWTRGDHLARTWHNPTHANEARIWLLAFLPPLLLVLAGWLASHFRYAIYVTCALACADALALTVRLHRWQVHHTSRFAYGEDLISDPTPSSSIARGEWERDAAHTVRSLVHYTVGLALAAAAIAAFRRLRHRQAPVEAEGSELQQTGGAPTVSGA